MNFIRGQITIKRLLFYLNKMENSTTTYRYTIIEDGQAFQRDFYDGECGVVFVKPGGETLERMGVRREPTYWRDDISYTFEHTNRIVPDRPTVTIAIPAERIGINELTPAAADFCLRRIKPYFDGINTQYANKARPDSENGKFCFYVPGSEVLVRNAAYFAMRPAKEYENGSGAVIYVRKFEETPPDRMCLCIRIEIQLPIGKLKRAIKMLTGHLPDVTEQFIREFDRPGLSSALELEAKQNEIRRFLREGEYCVFIANGSILAREKDTELPMKNALPFQSTPNDEIEIAGVRGMGIRRGVTVISGGGYSGKSTVLNAVSAGIYNHVEGDGRELCITDERAVTITSEDGRAVSNLNISPFIKWIPGGDTRVFSTTHASGSTSQAANIVEAIECGAALLLIDEDRSATNFMIRDALMKKLIEKEPITPFTDRVQELASDGISTILVIGGSGEYLAVADKVYIMDDFVIGDASLRAKSLAQEMDSPRRDIVPPPAADWVTRRVLQSDRFTSYPEGATSEKLEVSDTGFVVIGDERIDVRALHGIATAAQTNTLAFMLRFLVRETPLSEAKHNVNELEMIALAIRGIERKRKGYDIDVAELVRNLYAKIEENGINVVDTGFFTTMNRFLDLPREFELRAAINRMRHVNWANGE